MADYIHIGCSGCSYPHWRKRFYPENLPARDHFAYYAQHFNTVELNNSFYRQPPRERFEAWREQAPPGFLFAVKGSRYVTHIKRLAVEPKSIDLGSRPPAASATSSARSSFSFRRTSTSILSA